MCGMSALNEGERKLEMSQNLHGFSVWRRTLSIMMNAMRWAITHSYKQRRTDLVQEARGDGEDVDRLAGSRRLQRVAVADDLLR